MDTTTNLEKLEKEETLRLRKKHIGGSVTLFFKSDPLKIVRASGQYMYDEKGNKFLDCINNVAHVGHCNPTVTQAATEQMSLLYTNSRYLHDNLVIYAKRLTNYFPGSLKVCYFVNSGSEANDLAIRLARAHTQQKDVICLDGAYHGHLTTTIDISPYKFTKINPGANGTKSADSETTTADGTFVTGTKKNWVHVASLPCSYRGKYTRDEYGNDEEKIGSMYAQDVQKIINLASKSGRKIGAFIHESMVSCGGQVILPKGYLEQVYKSVRASGGVTIADEVQVGFGRVGKAMWAFQTYGEGVVPDIVTLGKPIGNGHPIAAVVTTPEIAASFENIGTEYFNTYGGNPVSLAVANAVLDVIEQENLAEKASKTGKILLSGLDAMKLKYKFIGDVRGMGLFIGIDLVKDPLTKAPAGDIADYVVKRFKDEKVIMSTEGKYGNVLKLKPPMTFNTENAEYFLVTLDMIFTEVASYRNTSTASSSSIGGWDSNDDEDNESSEDGYSTRS